MLGKSGIRDKQSIHALAIQILRKNNAPMYTKEIKEIILQKRNLSSKCPTCSVCSVLQRSKFIKRTGMSKYELK